MRCEKSGGCRHGLFRQRRLSRSGGGGPNASRIRDPNQFTILYVARHTQSTCTLHMKTILQTSSHHKHTMNSPPKVGKIILIQNNPRPALVQRTEQCMKLPTPKKAPHAIPDPFNPPFKKTHKA